MKGSNTFYITSLVAMNNQLRTGADKGASTEYIEWETS